MGLNPGPRGCSLQHLWLQAELTKAYVEGLHMAVQLLGMPSEVAAEMQAELQTDSAA